MYQFIKRIVDVIFSLLLLMVLSPLLIPIIIGLKLTGENYIWYKQTRVGYKNKKFLIWKFATMLKDSPNMGGGIMTTKRDPRITPMGGFLRTSKINELPQLINILLGHMTLIGPRPVMPISFNAYPDRVREVIYNVRPGLTGIGSIVFRNEEELITQVKESGGDTWAFYTEKIYPFKGELEDWYQQNVSFITDFKLFFLTVWIIFSPKSQLHKKVLKGLPEGDF